jgi:hypothetical protein
VCRGFTPPHPVIKPRTRPTVTVSLARQKEERRKKKEERRKKKEEEEKERRRFEHSTVRVSSSMLLLCYDNILFPDWIRKKRKE